MVKICIFERSNEKNYFSKTKIYFYDKTTPQLLEHIWLQNIKVGGKTNSGDLPLFVRCMLTLALNYFVSIPNVRLTWIYTPVFTADPNASITVI